MVDKCRALFSITNSTAKLAGQSAWISQKLPLRQSDPLQHVPRLSHGENFRMIFIHQAGDGVFDHDHDHDKI